MYDRNATASDTNEDAVGGNGRPDGDVPHRGAQLHSGSPGSGQLCREGSSLSEMDSREANSMASGQVPTESLEMGNRARFCSADWERVKYGELPY